MARRPPAAEVLPVRSPVYQHVLTGAADTFLWRQDDYPCERNGWNIHPEVEIHLITNAAGITLVGDHVGRFEPGHLSVVGSSLPHDWVTELAPGEVIRGRDVVLQFDPARVVHAAAALPELSEAAGFMALAQRGLAFRGETRRIGAELLLAIGPARGMERLSLFLRLLHLLSRSSERTALSSGPFAPTPAPDALDLIQRVLAHVFEHATAELCLADLAAMGGMSESQFSRFFKRNTGNSFTDHVTKLRISRACDLLANSTLPVTDVCYEVGYTNISNFNRNFRRQRGSTPSEYRRLARRRAG